MKKFNKIFHKNVKKYLNEESNEYQAVRNAINQYYWEVLNNYVIKLGSRTITKDDIAKHEHWSELMLNNWGILPYRW